MVTEFGKYIRKRRIDKVVTLREMADAMGLSPSYLSSVETGKRNITDTFLNEVVNYLKLKVEEVTYLHNLAAISQKEISISIERANDKQKNSAVFFARKLNTLNSDELDKINKILEGK